MGLYVDSAGAERAKPRPSTAFLIVLNGLIFMGLAVEGASPMGVLLAIPMTGLFMAFSLLPQLIVLYIAEDKRSLRPLPRTVAFLSPALLLALAAALIPQQDNKQNPAASPDSAYIAHVSLSPEWWLVRITDGKGVQEWIEMTPFVSHFSIYWKWDAQGRFWLYNSDDGRIYYVERLEDGWTRRSWGSLYGVDEGVPPGVKPPEGLWPQRHGRP